MAGDGVPEKVIVRDSTRTGASEGSRMGRSGFIAANAGREALGMALTAMLRCDGDIHARSAP